MAGVDGGQHPPFCPDVSQSPAQVISFLNVKIMERIALLGHFAGDFNGWQTDLKFKAHSVRFVPMKLHAAQLRRGGQRHTGSELT